MPEVQTLLCLVCLVKQGLLVLSPGTSSLFRRQRLGPSFRLWINNNGPSANRPLNTLDPTPGSLTV